MKNTDECIPEVNYAYIIVKVASGLRSLALEIQTKLPDYKFRNVAGKPFDKIGAFQLAAQLYYIADGMN